MLDKIKKDIDERMSQYTDSRHPTDDEVSIAWLVSEVERLQTATRNTLFGCRVAPHAMTYIPAYGSNNNCYVPSELLFQVIIHDGKIRTLRATGRVADALAKKLSPGKQMDFVLESDTVKDYVLGPDAPNAHKWLGRVPSPARALIDA